MCVSEVGVFVFLIGFRAYGFDVFSTLNHRILLDLSGCLAHDSADPLQIFIEGA